MEFCTERPWLKNYMPGVRPSLEYPKITLSCLLDDAAAGHPEKTAIIFAGREIKYGELAVMVNRAATALSEMGVSKGDRVSIMLPNCPQLVIGYYAALKIGAIVVQTNPMYMEKELKYQINDSGSETIIALDAFYPRIKNIKDEVPLKNIIIVSFGTERSQLDEGAVYFDELVKKYPPEPPEADLNPEEDLAVLQYTGGTTGLSKGAMLTHMNLLSNTLQTKEVLAADSSLGEDRILVALPLFHVYGMTAGMNLAIALACAQILVPRFEVNEVLQIINKFKPTLFPGAPTMYIAINNHPKVKEYDISSIRNCISGSAPLPVEVAQKFEALTGGNLVEGYGLTEASPVTHVNPLKGKRKLGSIGLPLPDTDCAIVDLETGEKELPYGEVGELVCRGPQVMKGYWNMPEETKDVLRNGWLYTGDIAKMDEEGYVYIVDRKKDMVCAGGFNVYPRDVEEVLFEHPKVVEAAVVGVPDPYRGETVKAFIVLKEGETATSEEIIEFCRERMAAYKVPKKIEFRPELPKTVVGKVLRRVLAEEERKKAGT